MKHHCYYRGRLRTFRIFLFAVAVSLIFVGCIEQKPKVQRVGILCGLGGLMPTVDGFKDRMSDLGHMEGKNIAYDVHITDFDPVAEERILLKFVADKADIIFGFPSEVAIAAKAVTQGTDIPVVFSQTNIEGTDLVKSVPEPGGNITGVRFPGPDLAVKRFEILCALAPQAKRIWVPYSTKALVVPCQLAALRPVAARAGVTLVEAPAEDPAELLADLEKRANAADIGIDAVLFIVEPLAKTPEVLSKIKRLSFDRGIPTGGIPYTRNSDFTVFGVATDHIAEGRLAAQQAHKILNGISPGTIPVVSAESYFQINYRVAQKLGLNIPEGLLKQADEILR